MAKDNSKPSDNVDALKAMAGGADLDAKKQSQTENLTPDAIDAILAEGGTLPPSGQVDPNAPEPAAFEVAAPQASRAALQAKARAASAYQMKKFLLPLLVVFGVAMVAIAAVALFASAPQQPSNGAAIDDGWALLPPEGRYLGYIAGPLGVIFLTGALLFRMELKKSDKRSH